jgi:hypothetical protein
MTENNIRSAVSLAASVFVASLMSTAGAEPLKLDFSNETVGADPTQSGRSKLPCILRLTS